MPIYHRLGQIPHKRHTAFRKPDGSLYYEHLMGNLGFSGLKSLLYTLRRPTTVRSFEKVRELSWQADRETPLRLRHFRTHQLPQAGGDPVTARIPLLFNRDAALLLARPTAMGDVFYRNGQGDEVVYVTEGSGVLESQFGELPFRPGDFLVIPRGIIHRYRFSEEPRIFFIVESRGFVRTPDKYRNAHGQLLEHCPFSERDIRRPESLPVHDEVGEFPVLVKQGNALHRIILDHHPFDVVGWDGYYYPWAFNVEDFEPITGRVHQPPPVHQVFESDGFVIYVFVPRLFDYHPEAVPAPYNHSNIGCDEVIYYCSSEFMSRKRIEYGSITLHPDGLPHGPHPGKIEASIGKKETPELAVMVDTFEHLNVSRDMLACEDDGYGLSFLD